MRGEGDHRRGDPRSAGRHQRLAEIETRLLEQGAELLGRLPGAVRLEEAALRDVLRSGDMAGRAFLARIGLVAGEACRRTRVDDLLVGRLHLDEAAHLRSRRSGLEPAASGVQNLPFDGSPLRRPLRDAAVEQGRLDSEPPQHPPCPARRVVRAVVVQDDAALRGDAQIRHPRLEQVALRQHRRERIVRVDQGIEIEQ